MCMQQRLEETGVKFSHDKKNDTSRLAEKEREKQCNMAALSSQGQKCKFSQFSAMKMQEKKGIFSAVQARRETGDKQGQKT